MNTVVVSGVVDQVNALGKVLEATLVGKPHQGAFHRVRVKALGERAVERLLPLLTEGAAVLAVGSLVQREREGRPPEVEVVAQKVLPIPGAEVVENERGRYLANAVNRVYIAGYLGKDADLKLIPIKGEGDEEESVLPLMTLRVAVWAGKDRTVWVPVKVWGGEAEVADQLRKGTFVALEGRYRLESFGEGEEKRFRAVVIGERIVGYGRKGVDEEDFPF